MLRKACFEAFAMSFKELLRAMRARYLLVALVFGTTVAAGVLASLYLPKQYVATASVIVDVKSPDPIVGMFLPSNQMEIITSDRVARKVVKRLGLSDSGEAREEWLQASGGQGDFDSWLAARIRASLDVRLSRDTNVLNLTYKATHPALAAAFANAFAQAYIDTTVELKLEPAREYAQWSTEQGKTLRENLERAQNRLTGYQQTKGIIATDERLDAETTKLSELISQLTLIQAQTADARSKQRSGSAADSLPEVTHNALIQTLKTDIAHSDSKLQELAVSLGRNHPQYVRAESELRSLRQKLDAETQKITSGFSTSRSVGRDKETELRAAIDAQKVKLLNLKSQRDEAAALRRDVETSQRAFDAVSERINLSTLQSRSTQTNVAILSVATEPSLPSFPKPLGIMVLYSVALGVALGGAAAYLLELMDPRIRSVDDLARTFEIPVLGMVLCQRGRRGPIAKRLLSANQ
jgi:chain length determinant protein EpsF